MEDDLNPTKSTPPPHGRAGSARPARADRPPARRGGPLVTSRNNFHAPSPTSAFDVPRPSVSACCKATLATITGSAVRFGALTCKSWSCPVCRKVNAARTLDAVRAGMESRPDWHRWFITATIDPARYGAVPIGQRYWDAAGLEVANPADAVRASTMWSEPTRAQFDAAISDMSKGWRDLTNALNEKCRRAELPRWEYFRTTELHRNVWPHYHAVVEHATIDEAPSLDLWTLGRVDVSPVSIDDAVGELAPYLICSETKGKGGHKAYQFAAPSLPRGFRLYSPSRGFLKRPQRDAELHPAVDHAVVVRGHFTSHHETARAWGAESRLLLPTPAAAERPHRPPSSCLATGDGAVLLYAELARATALHERPATALGAPGPGRAPHDEDPAPSRAGAVPPDDPVGTAN